MPVYRPIVPALRGFAPTRFRAPDTPRTGQVVALAQDALDLLDGLGLDRAVVVGHDWGARAGYALAALAPERLSRLVAVSVGFTPGARRPPAGLRAGPAVVVPVVPDARRRRRGGGQGPGRLRPGAVGHLEPGRLVRGGGVRRDRRRVRRAGLRADHAALLPGALGRLPARSGVRAAGGEAGPGRRAVRADAADPRRLGHLHRPGPDRGPGPIFSAGYRRVVVPGAGHFVPREAPGTVADLVLDELRAG